MATALLIDTLDERVEAVFGADSDPMWALDLRALELLWDEEAITWERDARTFEFWHVSAAAEAALGWPRTRWIVEPGFWAQVVVHPDDRDRAVSTLVARTAACRDHELVYRARASDGRTVRLREIVKVITGDGGGPECLRGVTVVERD